MERKEYDRAIADRTEVLRLIGPEADEYRNRGLAWLGKKDFAKAIADFDESIRLKPDFTEALVDRGIAYAIQGQHDRAMADYAAALRRDPKHALALYARGLTKLKSGDAAGNADIAAAKAIKPDIAQEYENIAGR